jgi:hypothetical protein
LAPSIFDAQTQILGLVMHTQSVYNKTQISVCSLPDTSAFFIGEVSPKKEKEKMKFILNFSIARNDPQKGKNCQISTFGFQ